MNAHLQEVDHKVVRWKKESYVLAGFAQYSTNWRDPFIPLYVFEAVISA
jgi:hypothetical protein